MEKTVPVLGSVNDILVVSNALDCFDKFNQDLKNLAMKYSMADIMKYLEKLKDGKIGFFKRQKIYQFYQENKDTVDTIAEHSGIVMFFLQNYKKDGTMRLELDYYYRYLLTHQDEKEKIQSLLLKLDELGIEKIEMKEDIDFTEKEYQLNLQDFYSFFGKIFYLDNIEIIPSYENNVIKYRSKGSNYQLLLKQHEMPKIVLNNLTFPIENLPSSIDWDFLWKNVLKLTEGMEQSMTAFRNSVMLDVSLYDLKEQVMSTCNTFKSIDSVNNKPELVEALSQIKRGIVELYSIKKDYDAEIITEYPLLSQQQIGDGVQQYVKVRENTIDID